MSKIIKSINYDQIDIINNIIDLHIESGVIDCDPTYSTGNFYKNGKITQPKYKYDIKPQSDDIIECDCTKLPLDDNSLNSIIFDPPFVISKGPSLNKEIKKGSLIITNRFSSCESIPILWDFYTKSIKEFYRVLNKNGILIFKCQDTVNGGKNYFSHIHVMNESIKNGFYPKDLFVLLAKSRIIGKMKKQQHARKFHSYFLVLQKKKVNIPYNL
jgi:hypothetical protein